MLNPCSKPWLLFIPNLKKSSREIPSFGQKLEKYLSINSIGNISFPAGTGVCVVNTVFAEHIDFATSNDTCFSSIMSFITSNVKNAECPSFIWHTAGFNPKRFNNFIPAIPKTISCLILISWSPPYNLKVTTLSSAIFLSISESIKYREILPTTIFHIFKYNFLSGKSTSIIKSSPFSSFTGKIGKLSKSIFVYSVF